MDQYLLDLKSGITQRLTGQPLKLRHADGFFATGNFNTAVEVAKKYMEKSGIKSIIISANVFQK